MEQLYMVRITLFYKDCSVRAFITYFSQTEDQANKLREEFNEMSENKELDIYTCYAS